jgi:S1-C subfamily serine protease
MTSSETGSNTADATGEPAAAPIRVIVHLSGSRRGTTQRLRGDDDLRLGKSPEVEIAVSPEPQVADHHATFHRQGLTYELVVQPGEKIWVNGAPVERHTLASGDLLEIGKDGPVLRFRIYAPGTRVRKTLAEAFDDSVKSARAESQNPMGQAALVIAGSLRDFATKTSLWFRIVMVVLAALLAVTVLLSRHSLQLERRLEEEEMLLRGISELLEGAEGRDLSLDELVEIREEISVALSRVEALEARTEAPARIVAEASQSVLLLQGAYGFAEPESGRPLRFLGIGEDGLPLRDPDGNPLIGLGGNGPPLESFFTGTAFLVGEDSLLLTNRHVIRPWEYEVAAQLIASEGLVPVMRRLIGFIPGFEEPLTVEPLAVSDIADLAVIRCAALSELSSPLPLAAESPSPGDEVIVLGYPAGIPALLARADDALVDELMADDDVDFWGVTRRLSAAGHIAPLASRGIVAQVTPSALVYDAETTRGGSGGPVLDLDGQVVAITSAVITEFGGSNIAVPVASSRELLLRARVGQLLPIAFR